MKKEITPSRDLAELMYIESYDKAMDDGGDYLIAFEHDGIAIGNPYMESTGRFEVDPIEEYGDKYVNWYNSLKLSDYDDIIDATELPEGFIGEWVEDDEGLHTENHEMFIKDGELFVWIDRSEWGFAKGSNELLFKTATRYMKMLYYIGEKYRVDYTDVLILPLENKIMLCDDRGLFVGDAIDFDKFIVENEVKKSEKSLVENVEPKEIVIGNGCGSFEVVVNGETWETDYCFHKASDKTMFSFVKHDQDAFKDELVCHSHFMWGCYDLEQLKSMSKEFIEDFEANE